MPDTLPLSLPPSPVPSFAARADALDAAIDSLFDRSLALAKRAEALARPKRGDEAES